MKITCAWMCIVGLLIMGASDSLAALPGACLNDDEVALLNLVDQYRADNGLSEIPRSKSLTTVAQWHVVDANENDDSVFDYPCNLHSWSSMNPGLWSGMCYTPDHKQSAKMWVKPREITGGIFTGNGFEIAGWGYQSVEAVMAGWQGSAAHNAVILNDGVWAGFPWKAMGVGVDLQSRYYFIWFSDRTDSQGEVPACSDSGSSEDGFFISSFE